MMVNESPGKVDGTVTGEKPDERSKEIFIPRRIQIKPTGSATSRS